MNIRNSAKAVIISGDKVLLTKNRDRDGYFYLFPGGGQEHGETLHKTLIRECIEETGEQIEVGELLHLREYIGKNHEYASADFNVHQVEYYFDCKRITGKNALEQPANPDSHQVGVEWVHMKDLQEYRLYPKEIRKYIVKYAKNEQLPVYLGDIN
ncbi:NUDIX domain-containing protein [Bacillus sp. H-16]|uniref:NUDIX domain-containing protein n=1 Tax=Alteribacter salitolerans TaxID=2912333 RepID=UPI001966ABAE|nr:NUDIX domain-containing protein [Alteribacter salitolerans]MBM7095194.1 NUDIX domain-containing protein [Alteribacter salitolerans]